MPAQVQSVARGKAMRPVRVAATRAVALCALSIFLLTSCAAEVSSESATAPETPTVPVDREQARRECALATLEDITLEEQVRSLIVLHVSTTDRAVLEQVVGATRVGGLIAMGDNILPTPAETATLFGALTQLGAPILLAVDQEGGDVSRIPHDTMPAGAGLHGVAPAEIAATFRNRAQLVRDSGLNTNFGIVADVTNDPNSFMYSRVLGTTFDEAATAVAAAVDGERGLVLSTLKHFPGHGASPQDSHVSLPTVDMGVNDWNAREAKPFQAGIQHGAEIVMLGHLVYSGVDALPASQSAVWVNILRDMPFDGLIITDDLRMLEATGLPEYQNTEQNAIRALSAGVTLLLFVAPTESSEVISFVDSLVSSVMDAIARGEISEQSLREEAARALIVRRNIANDDPFAWCSLLAGEYSVTQPPQVLEE